MSKRKSTPKTPPPESYPESFTDSDRAKIQAYCKTYHKKYCHFGPGGVREILNDMLDWHRENEVWRRRWVTTAKRWLRKQARMEFDYAVRNGHEIPQMDREATVDRDGVPKPVVLRLVKPEPVQVTIEELIEEAKRG